MADSVYDEVILDLIRNARNYREVPDADRRAEGFNPLCGDSFKVFLKIGSGRILDAAFQCECCGISMASASVMTELVRERTLEEAAEMARTFRELVRTRAQAEGLDTGRAAVMSVVRASPARGNCATLAWLTLEAAIRGEDSTTIGG
jgi:nitrogen fixation protein NifU and related proteins